MENQKRKVWSSKMTARREILSKINSRSNSGTTRSVPDFSIQLPGPEYAADLETDKIEQFKSMLIQVHGTCDQVGKIEDVPESVTKYLSGIQAQLHAVIATDGKLGELDWKPVKVAQRKAIQSDHSSVSMAFAGISETGTIAMVSSPDSPVTLNFLPEVNIVVLLVKRLVSTIEQFWPMIGEHPRAINFITGPSKTADIEQTIVYGAHGPKRFHVILVGSEQ
jgi:L-lactate dehydrogenase complex protein LldG